MVKKYVKGSLKNSKGVIKALEELGGINRYHKSGDVTSAIYFIDGDNYIDCEAKDTPLANIIMECFEEIQPIEPIEPEPDPKVITNLDVAKWYFNMIHRGFAVQFKLRENSSTIYNYLPTYEQDDAENYTWVRIDFGEWIPFEKVIHHLVINI